MQTKAGVVSVFPGIAGDTPDPPLARCHHNTPVFSIGGGLGSVFTEWSYGRIQGQGGKEESRNQEGTTVDLFILPQIRLSPCFYLFMFLIFFLQAYGTRYSHAHPAFKMRKLSLRGMSDMAKVTELEQEVEPGSSVKGGGGEVLPAHRLQH